MNTFATYKAQGKTISGIVIKKNSLTTIIRPVEFVFSQIMKRNRIIPQNKIVIVHNKKQQVRIYPLYIIPIN